MGVVMGAESLQLKTCPSVPVVMGAESLQLKTCPSVPVAMREDSPQFKTCPSVPIEAIGDTSTHFAILTITVRHTSHRTGS